MIPSDEHRGLVASWWSDTGVLELPTLKCGWPFRLASRSCTSLAQQIATAYKEGAEVALVEVPREDAAYVVFLVATITCVVLVQGPS